MSATKTLIDLNREYLRQGQRLILAVENDVYVSTDDRLCTSSIGDHMRLVIEHYQRFLIGAQEGLIDYAARQQDRRIADDRNFAGSVIEQVVEGLKEMRTDSVSLRVRSNTKENGKRGHSDSISSIDRELDYLQAHTKHHFCMIALMLRIQGEEPPTEFGFAPLSPEHVSGS